MNNDGMLNIAIRAAREAGKIIARAIDRLDKITVHQKAPRDFFTEVDLAAEKKIIEIIHTAYPEHSFLTEEHGQITNELAETIWIVDPLDGTTNFVHGLPNCVVSIALSVGGVIEYGVIYHPFANNLFIAARGRGAQLNDRRMRVADRKNLDGALVSIGPPRLPQYIPTYLNFTREICQNLDGVRRSGSTALDLAYVAMGALDFFWNIDSKVWDIAAGMLMVKEAGGLVLDLEGGHGFYDHGNLVAGNPRVLRSALATLKPLLPPSGSP